MSPPSTAPLSDLFAPVADASNAAMPLGGWFHTLDPVLIPIAGDIAVRWYGLSYLAGMLAAFLLIRVFIKRRMFPIEPDRFLDAFLAMVVGLVVGGRLGYCLFYKPQLLWTFDGSFPWWGVLQLTDGGMASHGGMIGVILGVLWAKRGYKDESGVRHPGPPALAVLDAAALVAPIGLGFGRVANFINGELLGAIVTQPGERAPWWAVRYPHELLAGYADVRYSPDQIARLDAIFRRNSLGPLENERDIAQRLITLVQRGDTETIRALEPLLSARYPSQLFQAIGEGVVVLLVVWVVAMKPRRAGVLGAAFLIAYGLVRVITEHWRLPDSHLVKAGHATVAGLTRGQLLSVLMVLAGGVIIAVAHRRAWPKWGGWRRRPDTDPHASNPPSRPVQSGRSDRSG